MKISPALFIYLSTLNSLNVLKEKEFDYYIKAKHVFVVACNKPGPGCEKMKNDFEDEWDNFDYKNGKIFQSKLFELTKTSKNSDFFNSFTENTDKNIIIYVENKNEDFKKFFDPAVASQRKLRAWLRSIEAEFSDKTIDQKIADLDRIINGQKEEIAQNNTPVNTSVDTKDDIIADNIIQPKIKKNKKKRRKKSKKKKNSNKTKNQKKIKIKIKQQKKIKKTKNEENPKNL